HRASGSQRALAAAIRCGEKLLASSKPTGRGVSWFIRIGGDEPQTGFSHGASGIALALFDLASASGDERFRATAMAAMEFEREAFWLELERWLRDPEREAGRAPAGDAEKSLAMTWCYGAPGVGLARRGALRSVEDAILREELARATAITLERGFGSNHSICHGDLGNLDLLLEVQCMNG